MRKPKNLRLATKMFIVASYAAFFMVKYGVGDNDMEHVVVHDRASISSPHSATFVFDGKGDYNDLEGGSIHFEGTGLVGEDSRFGLSVYGTANYEAEGWNSIRAHI